MVRADPGPPVDRSALVERVRAAYGGCFACGRDNPFGLRINDFVLGGDGWVSGRFTPRPEYRGAGDTLHGGVAATALDEAQVWAGILTEGVLTVTARLRLRYRRPLVVGTDLVARGRVVDRSGRRLSTSGALVAAGEVAVEARGLYIVSETFDEDGDRS